ncbi:MAG: acyl-CoA/acyl-ACP dehydrogenase [Ilumatobacteraceae bacterium]|nr:acyl-CoA/acyl-ACP dehydrogenase [Ilumatobacteraceae bacterium]
MDADLMRSPEGIRLEAEAARIGREVVAVHAPSVDAESRFPTESFAAIRDAGLLAALVPTDFGGGGCTYADVAAICTELGRHCGSTSMIYAMHQIQVACVVQHGVGVPHFEQLLREIPSRGRLIASATTEGGVGGDVRSSICAVLADGDRFTLEKLGTVISYGLAVEDILVTARRNPDAPASDQVILHIQRPEYDLEQVGAWDAFGMRGTCSDSFTLRAQGSLEQIVPQPYAVLSERTMLPVTHIFWASTWLGIASDAVERARASIRAAARRNPGTLPPRARDLARLQAQLDVMRSSIQAALVEYAHACDNPEATSTMGFAIRMNDLKLSASVAVAEIIEGAMRVAGLVAYRNDTPYSLGRHMRDSHSAALMVHNERLIEHNANLLCLAKEV